MPTTLQMPVRSAPAEKVGKQLFRKQVLRVGTIEHEGKPLKFSRPYLESLVESFKNRAYDQVPFVLADEKNRHNEDPERFRGEVKDVQLNGDSLDVVVQLSKRGAALIEENPKLPVSARIVEGLKQSDGREFPRALRHVCATMDPVVTGLQDWEPLSIRSLSQSSDQQAVIDLTAATYEMPPLTEDQIKKLNELPEDQRTALDVLIEGKAPEPGKKDEPKPADDKQRFPALRKLLGLKKDSSDDDLDAALAKLSAGDEPTDEKDKADAPDLAGASLSKEAREAIDLARTDAASAKDDVVDLAKQLSEANWKNERRDYEDEGVPPSLLDLAAPVMTSAAKTIDLSNGETVDPKALMRKMLDEAKGTIDLSTRGSAKDKELEDQAKDLASDEKWNASI